MQHGFVRRRAGDLDPRLTSGVASPGVTALVPAADFRAALGCAAALGFAAALGAGLTASDPMSDARDSAVSTAAAFDDRGDRRFGAASVDANAGTASTSGVAPARADRVVGLRVARLVAAGAAVFDGVSSSGSTLAGRTPRPSTLRPSVTGPGFCATCARSNASSSGGTSLHGSFELRDGGGTESRSGRL